MPEKCIFCENNSGSGEHIYPCWSHDYLKTLDQGAGRSDIRGVPIVEDDGTISLLRTERRRKTEMTISTRSHVVCDDCNNGWMSDIENATKPILLPMIIHRIEIMLSKEQINKLIIWFTLKFMCMGTDGNKKLFEREECIAFRETRKIPVDLEIFIGSLDSRYWELSWRCARAPMKPDDPNDERSYPVASIVWGIGGLVVYCSLVQGGYIAKLNKYRFLKLQNIYPLTLAELRWPFAESLRTAEVDELETAIFTLPAKKDPDRFTRRRIKLQVDNKVDGADLLAGPLDPGNEFTDLICGSCSEIIVRGMSLDTMRRKHIVKKKLLISCAKCEKFNFVPVRVVRQ